VRLVADEALPQGNKAIFLWDFSQFNDYTEEAIPAKGDRQAKMRWYWEAGHFKKELGDLVLNRIFGRPGSREGFGILLNSENVEAQIAKLRAQEASYRLKHAQQVEALEELASGLDSR